MPATALAEPSAFFAYLRAGKYLGPTLTVAEVSGCQAILEACSKACWPVSWAAYALGTAWHETAHTMQPVKEFGGEAYFKRRYDIEGLRPDIARQLGNVYPGDGALFCGRGYPQTTGRANYVKLDKRLGLGGLLITTPDVALRSDIAADMMVCGMGEGLFTGKSLADYLPSGPAAYGDFLRARRVVNGVDRAADIANAALHFQAALVAGGWE